MKVPASQLSSSPILLFSLSRRLFSFTLHFFISSLSSLGKTFLKLADLDMDFSKVKAHEERMTKANPMVDGDAGRTPNEHFDEITEFRKTAWSIDKAWEDGQLEPLTQAQVDANIAREKTEGGEVR